MRDMKLEYDPLRSSSSRRESSPAPEKLRAKSIGCMSGLFRLVSRSHNRRKFLTFGKKQEKDNYVISSSPARPKKAVTPSSAVQLPSSPPSSSSSTKQESNINSHPRFACEIPRSPTLPAEIRLSSSSSSSSSSSCSSNAPVNFRGQPALVARLMGLDSFDYSSRTTTTAAVARMKTNNVGMAGPAPEESDDEEEVEEKRRRLLTALEKCDEDLKALKKMIEVVRSVGGGGGGGDGGDRKDHYKVDYCVFGEKEKKKGGGGGGDGGGELLVQQPSPVSVLDEFTRSAFSGYSRRYTPIGRVPLQQKKKPGDQEDTTNINFFGRITSSETMHGRGSTSENTGGSTLWTSKAMVESVNEVCKDIAWGERREIGRIGLALQDTICRDLIDEIVKEMGCIVGGGNLVSPPLPLPFDSCKRRLRF